CWTSSFQKIHQYFASPQSLEYLTEESQKETVKSGSSIVVSTFQKREFGIHGESQMTDIFPFHLSLFSEYIPAP
uniref:Uncharacterized protein n=1 Tax=Megaselia scalaris TaxID=36166 RepID=T1H0S4_MEGSC